MKVFISWSGARSKALAVALKDTIPLILQYVKPWVSDRDISAGDRWALTVSSELEASNFGILCLTPENITSEWILFEAGALSKSMQDSKVIPLLLGLELSDLRGPLSQFQAQKVDEGGILKVVKAINDVAEIKADDATVEQLTPLVWASLKSKLDNIPADREEDKFARAQDEILEDLVSEVRSISARIRDLDPESMERDIQNKHMRYRDEDPRMVVEMLHMLLSEPIINTRLVLLAGFLRNRMPWLTELLLDAHRELKLAEPGQKQRIFENIMRVARLTTHGPLGKQMMNRNGFDKFLVMNLPSLIKRSFDLDFKERETLHKAAEYNSQDAQGDNDFPSIFE